MLYLKNSTAAQVVILGPFIDDTDGKTPKTGLSIANTDILVNKHGASTLVAKNSGGATEISNGYYFCTLDATDTNTVGRLVLSVKKATSLIVWNEFMVLAANIFDTYLGTDIFDASLTQVEGTALGTHASGMVTADLRDIVGAAVSATTAQLGVNAVQINAVATTPVTTIGANLGETQPINFTGTGANALVKGDVVDIAGAAVSTSSAQIGANVVSQANIDFGALQKTSLNAATPASVVGAVGSVTGSVGSIASGGIVAASFATDSITAAKIAADAIIKINDGAAVATGLARANTDNTCIVLAVGESSTEDLYVGCLITIVSGTGLGQARMIAKYDGTNKIAYVNDPWVTIPTTNSGYRIFPSAEILLADTGRPQAITGTTIQLATTAPAIANTYIGHTVFICGGTGIGQARIITAYAADRTCTVRTWDTNPTTSSIYMILPVGRVFVNEIAAGAITAAVIADNAIDIATFAADVKTGTYLNAQVKAQDNIDFGALQKASLNAATPAVTVSDKTGFSLSASGIDSILDEDVTGHTTASTLGLYINRIFWMINNKMTVNETTGDVTLRNIADSANVATGNVASSSGTTTRAVLSWV